MTELGRYKKALEKISQYGIKPTGETELQRIKRLKSIADKALSLGVVVERSEQCACGSTQVYTKPSGLVLCHGCDSVK